ncbi:MAG: hypothetical protein AABW46_01600 [Nanoarchaeota archaeon]
MKTITEQDKIHITKSKGNLITKVTVYLALLTGISSSGCTTGPLYNQCTLPCPPDRPPVMYAPGRCWCSGYDRNGDGTYDPCTDDNQCLPSILYL